MWPRDLFTKVDYFDQIWIQACSSHCLTKRFFMHARRTRCNDYSVKLVGFYVALNHALTRFRTHVSIMPRHYNFRQAIGVVSHLLNVNDASNVQTAMTNVDAYPGHPR
jgi:hypothetical protein